MSGLDAVKSSRKKSGDANTNMQPNLWTCIADEFGQRPSLNRGKIFLQIPEIISFQNFAQFALTMIVPNTFMYIY